MCRGTQEARGAPVEQSRPHSKSRVRVLSALSALALQMLLLGRASPSAALLDPLLRSRLEASGIVGSGVLGALDQQDRVRVIVAFRIPGANSGGAIDLSREAFDKPALDAAVATTTEAIIAKLPPGEFTVVGTFVSANGIVLSASPAAIDRLISDPAVLRVDGDRVIRPGLREAVPLVHLDAVHALPYTGAGVTVAVIDSGIDRNHPDLANDVASEECFCAVGGGCCPTGTDRLSGPGSAPDGRGHGTHVAGVITSDGRIAPIGGAPAAKVIAIKVLNAEGNGFVSDTAKALDWILNNAPAVTVVNVSLVSDLLTEGPCDNVDGVTMLEATAISNLRYAKVSVFAASGNDGSGTQMTEPACISSAFGVGAVWDAMVGTQSVFGCTDATRADLVACYSNTNALTAFLAPGGIMTSSYPNSLTANYIGTSQATPIAAACAAVLKEVSPELSPADIRLAMRDSRTRLVDGKNGVSLPRVDCLDAVMQVQGGTGLCPPTPRTTCHHTATHGSESLRMQDYVNSDAHDKFSWSWRSGTIVARDLGDPTRTSSYSVCLYHEAASPLVLNLFLPAGETCASKPCWTPNTQTGFKYRDRLLSPSGVSYGLFAPNDIAGRIFIKAKGVNLRAPGVHLNLPVRVQLINQEGGACFESVYSHAITNTTGQSPTAPGTFAAAND